MSGTAQVHDVSRYGQAIFNANVTGIFWPVVERQSHDGGRDNEYFGEQLDEIKSEERMLENDMILWSEEGARIVCFKWRIAYSISTGSQYPEAKYFPSLVRMSASTKWSFGQPSVGTKDRGDTYGNPLRKGTCL